MSAEAAVTSSPPPRMQMLLKAGRAASAGYFIVVALLLGAAAGWWADTKLGTEPWGLLAGFGLGMAAAARELWVIARTTHLGGTPEGPKTPPGPGDQGRVP